MRVCSDHFAHLRAGMAGAGLLATTGPEGRRGYAVGYDPMARANGAIFATFVHAARDGGHEDMLLGDRCPLCQVESIMLGAAEAWMAAAIEDQLVAQRAALEGAPRQ